MPDKRKKLVAVPTNIITGFLGVGKTTAILNLLKQKPEQERWAILINEFGEIGVDSNLVQGQSAKDADVFIKEVPGGCMCCAAGLPMQIALNLLLQKSRPHRLLIEPTGLGHPVEVMQALAAEHYREVIDLQKTVTLVDARKLSDDRYASNPTFNQQLDIADIFVANKEDLYSDKDRAVLAETIHQHSNSDVELQITRQGKINIECLKGAPFRKLDAAKPHNNAFDLTLSTDLPFPSSGLISATNNGEGFSSKGWRFSPEIQFDRTKLLIFLNGLRVERLKAVFITSTGIFGYNMTPDALTEIRIDDSSESRIEIIADGIDTDWEKELLNCRANDKYKSA
ncbi:MAG: GTP-binding protein [Pseudohongiellaceae bacterium]